MIYKEYLTGAGGAVAAANIVRRYCFPFGDGLFVGGILFDGVRSSAADSRVGCILGLRPQTAVVPTCVVGLQRDFGGFAGAIC